MATWYKRENWNNGIESVRVERETEHSIWIRPRGGSLRRCAKSSQYGTYFRNRDDAVRELLELRESIVADREEQLAHAKNRLADLLVKEADAIRRITGQRDERS